MADTETSDRKTTSYDSLIYLREARRIPRARSLTSFQPQFSPKQICGCLYRNGRYNTRSINSDYNGDKYAWDNYWVGMQGYYNSLYSGPEREFPYHATTEEEPAWKSITWYLSKRSPQYGYKFPGHFMSDASIYGLNSARQPSAAYQNVCSQVAHRPQLFDEPMEGTRFRWTKHRDHRIQYSVKEV